MNVIMITGFLGAGKTSVLLPLAQRIAERNPNVKTSLAIIENEIGQTGVDDATLAGSGSYEVRTLFSGCVCCTLAGEMVTSIRRIAEDLDPLYVVIEPSGVADPATLSENIETGTGLGTRTIAIVDAQRWKRIKVALAMLIPHQLGEADVVLVNKCDLADAATLDAIEADVRAYNPTAPIFRICAKEGISSDVLDALIGED